MAGCVGDPLPPGDIHSISVLLPTWKDTVGWSSRDPETLAHLKTGYPRFFIHRIIDGLSERLVAYEYSITSNKGPGVDNSSPACVYQSRLAVLFPCYQNAELCQNFLLRFAPNQEHEQIRILVFNARGLQAYRGCSAHVADWENLELFAVVYPAHLFSQAKSFWQHTGFGISSRYAAFWLENEDFLPRETARKVHYKMTLRLQEGTESKQTLRKRIAHLSSTNTQQVGFKDVFIYPTGMTGISNIASVLQDCRPNHANPCTIAVFGFAYVDTFKVLTKVHGFETLLCGHGSSSEIDDLESQLSAGKSIDALITEFPGNPLLKSPDLKRLRELSQRYQFVLIIDDTIGTFVNVALLPFCDLICTSLTKMFSGACNVMGGSVIVNPSSSHHSTMHNALSLQFIDTYFPPEAALMEANSRDYEPRVLHASSTAEAVCELLDQHPVVSQLFYPKGSPSQHIYDGLRRPDGTYGFLLSVTFVSPQCAIAFYDALDVAKGPSLGTNFTLACAYTLLAHYGEREWAARYGVVEHLVRISVGLEDRQCLVKKFQKALAVADEARVGGLGGRGDG